MLGAVTGVFWNKGFSGASLDDLQEAAGVSRPSLYTAFGDKRGMYARVLAAFRQDLEDHLAKLLAAERPVRADLAAFYQGAIDLYTSGEEGPRGCLVLCTAAAETLNSPDAKAVLHGVIEGLDVALESRFQIAAAAGELPAGQTAEGLSLHAAAVLHSLALRARAGQDRETLTAFATSGLNLLLGPA
jgi:AcrR family transcriptional regulator